MHLLRITRFSMSRSSTAPRLPAPFSFLLRSALPHGFEMNTHQDLKQEIGTNGGRPRRNIAKQVVERGQRLRNRAGVLIGMSLGLVALLSVLE
jgi:hypothetical protein